MAALSAARIAGRPKTQARPESRACVSGRPAIERRLSAGCHPHHLFFTNLDASASPCLRGDPFPP